MARSAQSEVVPPENPLALELQTYCAQISRLAVHEGRYVLIHHADVVGIYDTYGAAIAAGYEKLGVDKPFLVKRISMVENPVLIR